MAHFKIVNLVNNNNSTYELTKDVTKIGRLSDNDIILKHQRVSRYHAEVIFQKENEYIINDQYSSNGTFINEKKITKWSLEDEDQVRIGNYLLFFKIEKNKKHHISKPPTHDDDKEKVLKNNDSHDNFIAKKFVEKIDTTLKQHQDKSEYTSTTEKKNIDDTTVLTSSNQDFSNIASSQNQDEETILYSKNDTTVMSADEDITIFTKENADLKLTVQKNQEDNIIELTDENIDSTEVLDDQDDSTVLYDSIKTDGDKDVMLSDDDQDDSTVLYDKIKTDNEKAVMVSDDDQTVLSNNIQDEETILSSDFQDDSTIVEEDHGDKTITNEDTPEGKQQKVIKKIPKYRIRKTNLFDQLVKNESIVEEEKQDFISELKMKSLTPVTFLYQKKYSKRESDIDSLRQYCNLQYIDNFEKIVRIYKKTSISEKVFKKCKALTVQLENENSEDINLIHVVMADPTDINKIDMLSMAANSTVKPVYFSKPDIITKAIRRVFQTGLPEGVYNIPSDVKYLENKISPKEVTNIPIIDLVNYYIHKAMIERASDIHFEPTELFFVIKNRIDGILHEVAELDRRLHREVVARIKIICDMNIAERRRPQDGRFSVTIQKKKIDVRVSTFPTVHGEKVVLRLLEQDTMVTDLKDLGLSDNELELFKEKISAPYGMILLSGPTGSGKTTTLYSALSALNSGKINILTAEEPVEYRIQGIHQMHVIEKIGLTFASGLRTMLRQDPDVIMVGEIRDDETAEIAIRAALTGHIVFSTIHTNNAIGIVLRLTDMEIDPFLVSSSLTLAIAQRLYRTICEDCKMFTSPEIIRERLREDGVTDERLQKLGLTISEDIEYATGKGCPKCRGTGYFGRRALFEIFNVTQEAKDLIVSSDFKESSLKQLAIDQGMTTLLQAGKKAVDRGYTTIEEIIRVCGED